MITKRQFREEDRRIKRLRKQGWREDDIKSWLRGWRQVGDRNRRGDTDEK